MAFRLDLRPLHFFAFGLIALAPVACGGGGDDGDAPDDADGPADSGDTGTGGAAPDGGSGGSGPGTGGGGTNNPGDYLFPDGRGPRVPFSVYEAEAMDTNGVKGGPSRAAGDVNSESSGRQSVRLDAAGEYVAFTNVHAANALVIRYSIPDTGDAVKKLAVLVNDVQVALLDVTARYAWSYRNPEDNVYNQADQNNPGGGRTAHHFYDDVRALVGDIPAGATVKIQHPGGADAAGYYDIDLVETEQVAPPLAQPAGYKSITECGAVANDGQDDTAAIQSCIDGGGNLYIPEGEFHVNNNPSAGVVGLQISGRTIRGAGMWYSTIRGDKASFTCWGGGCKFYDFAVFGETVRRQDDAPTDDMAFAGPDYTDSVIENVWVEHRRAGLWTHGKGNTSAGTGVTVKNSRFRNLHADAVNFYGGVINGTVENCHVRNTGDDGLAIWSHDWDGRPNARNIVFKNNYIMAPWKANCFGIYGGEDISIEDNVCSETTTLGGMLIANAFDSHDFVGTVAINRNTLLRAGGIYAGGAKGALILEARDGNTDNIRVDDMDIVDGSHFGVHLIGNGYIGYSSLNNVTITNPTDGGFFLEGGSKGAIDATNVVYEGAATPFIRDGGSSLTVNAGAGNVGWSP